MSKQKWSENIQTVKTPTGYGVKIPDGLCSVMNTDEGKELFGGQKVSVYKAGIFEVFIAYETLKEIMQEVEGHIANPKSNYGGRDAN